jgi:hypothetical protein
MAGKKKVNMTNAQLRAVMKFHLKNFDDEGVAINDSTRHDAVLSATDGFGAANSKAVYKAVMRFTFSKTQLGDPDWPGDWMPMTVADLADFFI